MAFVGGSYAKEDDSLKIEANASGKHLITWDQIEIDSPHKDKICNIRLESCAGDVVYVIVTYYNLEAEEGEDKTWSEAYTLKDLKLSLRSHSRIAYADCIDKHNENERNKVLGIT